MFDQTFINRLKKTGIFFAVFTVIYILFFFTLPYTLPFVLAFIIALSIRPANLFIQKKLKIPNGIASLITTIFIFAVLIVIVTALIVKITNEAVLLVAKIPNVDVILGYFKELIGEAELIYWQLDPSIVEKAYQYLSSMATSGLNILIRILNSLLSFILKLPSILMLGFITFLATFLFSKDMKSFNKNFYSVFSDDGKQRMEDIVKQAVGMITGYVKAFSTVILITFIETLIGFTILGIDYAFILSLLASFMDVLPIVGVSIVYIPLVIFYFISGKTFVAVGIIVLLGVVTVVRQIVEPKLVSTSLDIHPIMTLAAIFIGLKAYGFIGMIYLIALIIFYKVLVKVKAL
ncbi:MAG: sporulation integral membrane protein YtvI [Tissierellales bacterium]